MWPHTNAPLFRKSIIADHNLIDVGANCRCLAAMITIHSRYKMLIVDVYLPCFEASCTYQHELLECIGFIENCIACNDYNNYIGR